MLTRVICLCLLLALKGLAQAEDPIQRSKALTAEGAAELEKVLATNSPDIDTRLTLMWYYAAHNSVESHLSQLHHIEWMIENHPDSELFQGGDAKLQPFFGSPAFKAELDHAKELWSRAAAASHDDPRVLDNAQNSLYWVDHAASIRYLMRLRRAEPENPKWVIGILRTYQGVSYENPKLAKSMAETDIEPSNDLAVTGCIGQLLFGLGTLSQSADPSEFASLGEKLLRKAQTQDPTSWRWERTISVLPGMVKFGAAYNNAGRASYFANWIQNSLREEDLWPGGKVAELPLPAGAIRDNSSDLTAPAPIPIQGLMPKADTSVRLEILIGTDGRVKKAQYVAGLAMLAEESVRAALQWRFKPRIEKGRTVEVLARIDDIVIPAPYSPAAKRSPGIPGGFGTSIGGVLGGIIGGLPGPPPPFVDPSLMAAQLIRRVEPVYPAAAGNAGVKGTVRFRATLGPDGAVTSLELASGPPILVNAARRAVAQWLYKPWIADGKQVDVSTTIDVEVK